MMNQNDKLKDFPKIKLSYENIIYKKVYNSDTILAIPEGKKCFAWFTRQNDKNVCYTIDIKQYKEFHNIKIANVWFSPELSYGTGTILYGTVFYHKNNRFFSIEDIFSYKGKELERMNWGDKFTILENVLSDDLKQIQTHKKSFIFFGLPLFSDNIGDFNDKIKDIKYNITRVQFRQYNRINNYSFMHYSQFMETETIIPSNNLKTNSDTNRQFISNDKRFNNKNILKSEVIFSVKPDIENDIYHLYSLNNDNIEEYYNVSHIPDYKTSVFMNSLFRNIKENINLDKLEESDDEEEFENEKEDKYVYLDRKYNIVCSYNFKFKKWVPIRLADNNNKIVLTKNLPIIGKEKEKEKEKK